MKIRHGDICLTSVESLPTDVKKTNSKIILAEGSGGNPHSIDKGELYLVKNQMPIIGYLVAKGTSLLHKEHGETDLPNGEKAAKIEDGIYKIIRQVEETHKQIRPVID